MTHEIHKGYRPRLEGGVFVWYKIYPKHIVGLHPDLKKPIKIAKSGHKGDNARVQTNTADYEQACAMLDRFLKRPEKEPEFKKDKNQTNLFG